VTYDSTEILARLAYNLRWAWHTPTTDLFHTLAPHVWDSTHNPIAVMRAVVDSPELLDARADPLVAAGCDLDNYLWRLPQVQRTPCVAYFSAEFAIAECLPIYRAGSAYWRAIT
jgi:starch phosphorylase